MAKAEQFKESDTPWPCGVFRNEHKHIVVRTIYGLHFLRDEDWVVVEQDGFVTVQPPDRFERLFYGPIIEKDNQDEPSPS